MTTYLVQVFFKGILIVGLFTLAALLSCEDQDEVPATQANINLLFSSDTLLFDTLLTDRLSVTKRLRIYNPNTEAISISEISLSVGTEYSLIINGAEENQAEDLLLMGKDSLLILVKLTVDKQDLDDPYLIKDTITTYWNGNIQQTLLMAWGQDAIYMGNEILCDMTFTADRPYVFYDSVLIDVGCLLTLEAGATLLFDANAPLLVAGQLIAVGDSSHPITFRNSRWDIDYRIARVNGLAFIFSLEAKIIYWTIRL